MGRVTSEPSQLLGRLGELLVQITSGLPPQISRNKCSILTNLDLKIEKPGPKVSSQDDQLYWEDRFPLRVIGCPANRCALLKWLRPPLNIRRKCTRRKCTSSLLNGGSKLCWSPIKRLGPIFRYPADRSSTKKDGAV